MTATDATTSRPAVLDDAARFLTTEYASLTRAGAPVTWPVTPYAGEDRDAPDIALERLRADVADPNSSPQYVANIPRLAERLGLTL